MSLSIKIIGAEKVAEKLKTFGDLDLRKAREKWLKEAAILVEGQAKKEAPVDKGILRKYIRSVVYDDHALVYNNIAYALPVHEGQKPHDIIIKPNTKKALFRKGAEHPIRRAVKVHHPGTKANPFFTRAVQKSQSRIQKRFSQIIDALANNRFSG
ncbi:MAG: hypothetical protein DLD55_00050 [candidate division SR1 bacterium]|nr:MAG: hypothetical protein DLD55_00050 [candidate division SR1 bacterium]